jgi:hypothetical protein
MVDMRTGYNPSKRAEANKPHGIVLAVITHMPNPVGYYSQKFEAIKMCFKTMLENANCQHWLAVWDNGSTPQFVDWLEKEIQPDILVRSRNIGKSGAQSALFGMFPPETILAYSDDDIYFYPDWLRPQLDVLLKYPNVSTVTGYPCKYMFKDNTNTIEWAKKHAQIEMGKFIPDKWEREYAISIGADPDKWMFGTGGTNPIPMIHYGNIDTFPCSHHCQFVGRIQTLSKYRLWSDKALDDAYGFDKTMNEYGLRLATTQRLVRHIGNVVDADMRSA